MPGDDTTPSALPPPPVRKRRWLRRRMFYPTLYAVFLLATMRGCVADRFILFPSTEPIAAADATRRTVAMPEGGPVEVFTARAIESPPGEPTAFLLVFNGNADRAEYAVYSGTSQAASHPVEVWAMNYPGYGGSAGPARMSAIAPAALATYDALKERAAGRPIFISGTSLGSAAALCVAARRPVAGLILTNPPPLRQMILGRYGWWNLWLIAGPVALSLPNELDSVANASKSDAPAVFILAGSDTIVPPKFQRMVVDAYKGQKQIVPVPDANHNDLLTGEPAAQAQRALDRLWAGIAPPTATVPTTNP